jgi:phosphate transport system substrate-binding protein
VEREPTDCWGAGSRRLAATVTALVASRRLGLTVALVVVLAATAACGAAPTGPTRTVVGTDPGGEAIHYAELTGTLAGSGATFPKGFYEEAIWDFQGVAPGFEVTYAGGGSGRGKVDLRDGVVDWAGTDSPVGDDELDDYRDGLLYVPTVAGAITVSYNLDGVDDLRLDADVVADIFERRIERWDDPAVMALNPGADLPSRPIVVARRADGSGTTTNFTLWLDKAAPNWTLGHGDTVEWPVGTQGGNGNGGVATIVKEVQGAIGYVDLSDAAASGLHLASVRNRDGEFVAPSPASTSAAVAAAELADDLTYDPLDAPGADAYPIAAPTWVIVSERQPDERRVELLVAWLTFLLTEGQDLAVEIDFAPLPEDLRLRSLAQLERITVR